MLPFRSEISIHLPTFCKNFERKSCVFEFAIISILLNEFDFSLAKSYKNS